jgi:hypothetical protein
MKAISIRTPWSWWTLHGKRLENRDRSDGRMPDICRHRGPLLLHASKWWKADDVADDFELALANYRAAGGDRSALPRVSLNDLRAATGGIYAVTTAIAHLDPRRRCWLDAEGREEDPEIAADPGVRSWHFAGSWGLVFDEVRAVPFSPWAGALGLFEVPDDVAQPLVEASR